MKIKSMIAALLCGAMLVGGAAIPVFAEEAAAETAVEAAAAETAIVTEAEVSSVVAGTVVRANSGLNMREGAGISYSSITRIPNGTVIAVLGKADSNWYKVYYSGNVGYVSGDYLTIASTSDGVSTETLEELFALLPVEEPEETEPETEPETEATTEATEATEPPIEEITDAELNAELDDGCTVSVYAQSVAPDATLSVSAFELTDSTVEQLPVKFGAADIMDYYCVELQFSQSVSAMSIVMTLPEGVVAALPNNEQTYHVFAEQNGIVEEIGASYIVAGYSITGVTVTLEDTSKDIKLYVVTDDGGLSIDGNMTLTDYFTTPDGDEFITVTTKNGSTFYIIIDWEQTTNTDGTTTTTQNVHFLNQVDEADLLELLDDEEIEAYQSAKATEATEAPAEATQPATTAPTEATTEATTDENNEKKNSYSWANIMLLIIVVGGIGAIFVYKKMQKKKAEEKASKPDPDADAAYTDEIYVSEAADYNEDTDNYDEDVEAASSEQ